VRGGILGSLIAQGNRTVPLGIIKFEEFELDKGRYELRRRSRPVKLQKVPMELLILLAEREGQLVTREEIIQRIWDDNVFVDTRQGINTAVRKIRLALTDDPEEPRILQTVVGKGYRLAAPLAFVDGQPQPGPVPHAETAKPTPDPNNAAAAVQPQPCGARPIPMRSSTARGFLLLIQFGYLIFYAASFIWFSSIQRMGLPQRVPYIVLVVALVSSSFRIYLISAIAADFPGKGRLFRQMFPGILILDAVWAASPLLLFPKLGYVKLLFVAGLAFLPFTQRTLVVWLCAAEDPTAAANGGENEPAHGRSGLGAL
jgi:DNA-binding winged helix-turn-helix (wHTH) protein